MTPLVGWEWLEKDMLKANLPYERLFPKDVAKRDNNKDPHGEMCLCKFTPTGLQTRQETKALVLRDRFLQRVEWREDQRLP